MENLFALIIFASFILLIIGLISPKTSLFWDKKNTPTRKRSSLIYGLTLLASFVLFGMFMDDSKYNKNSTSNTSTKTKEEKTKKEDIAPELSQKQKDSIEKAKKLKLYNERKNQTISAKDLYASYAANEVSADKNFKGKTFYVSGRIEEIKKDFMNDIYVTLKTGEMFSYIHCYLDDENVAAELHKNQKVTFKGKCDGMVLTSVVMKNCEFVKNLDELKP